MHHQEESSEGGVPSASTSDNVDEGSSEGGVPYTSPSDDMDVDISSQPSFEEENDDGGGSGFQIDGSDLPPASTEEGDSDSRANHHAVTRVAAGPTDHHAARAVAGPAVHAFACAPVSRADHHAVLVEIPTGTSPSMHHHATSPSMHHQATSPSMHHQATSPSMHHQAMSPTIRIAVKKRTSTIKIFRPAQ